MSLLIYTTHILHTVCDTVVVSIGSAWMQELTSDWILTVLSHSLVWPGCLFLFNMKRTKAVCPCETNFYMWNKWKFLLQKYMYRKYYIKDIDNQSVLLLYNVGSYLQTTSDNTVGSDKGFKIRAWWQSWRCSDGIDGAMWIVWC